MDTFQSDERAAQLAFEASRWLSRLEDSTDEDRMEFAQWLQRDPAHVREFMQIAALDEELHRFDPRKKIDVEALIAEATAVSSRAASPRRYDHRFWALAAGLVGFALMIQIAIFAAMPTYETQLSERQLVRLRDGSTIHLNTNTRVRVSFAYGRRSIELDRGEALFNVARDPDHPFVVRTPLASAVAVGTSFDVRRDEDWTRVTVLEGQVLVNGREILHAGDAATASGTMIEVQRLGVTKARKRTAWTQGKLELFGETLREAVDEMNRYNDVRIEISDPELARSPVTGTFDVEDPKAFAAAVTLSFNAVAEETAAGRTIEIRRKTREDHNPR
jgi:transmembrane sensor